MQNKPAAASAPTRVNESTDHVMPSGVRLEARPPSQEVYSWKHSTGEARGTTEKLTTLRLAKARALIMALLLAKNFSAGLDTQRLVDWCGLFERSLGDSSRRRCSVLLLCTGEPSNRTKFEVLVFCVLVRGSGMTNASRGYMKTARLLVAEIRWVLGFRSLLHGAGAMDQEGSTTPSPGRGEKHGAYRMEPEVNKVGEFERRKSHSDENFIDLTEASAAVQVAERFDCSSSDNEDDAYDDADNGDGDGDEARRLSTRTTSERESEKQGAEAASDGGPFAADAQQQPAHEGQTDRKCEQQASPDDYNDDRTEAPPAPAPALPAAAAPPAPPASPPSSPPPPLPASSSSLAGVATAATRCVADTDDASRPLPAEAEVTTAERPPNDQKEAAVSEREQQEQEGGQIEEEEPEASLVPAGQAPVDNLRQV